MAETDEHKFLSEEFLRIVESFSRTELYGLTEAERRRFDFECVFQRDWRRPLVGQTLWKHSEGVDKDLRILITNTDAEIWAYVIRDSVKHRALLHEVVRDLRASRYADQLFKLKVLWVPDEFDADQESDRITVGEVLKAGVVNDILFNVVFGRLTAADVKFFLNSSGMRGLNLAVLHTIATEGFVNYPDLQKRLQVSAGTLRERVLSLVGSGLLWGVGRGSLYFVTLKGRVFLELLDKLPLDVDRPVLWPELRFILRALDMEAPDLGQAAEQPTAFQWTPVGTYRLLIQTIQAATANWGVDLNSSQRYLKF